MSGDATKIIRKAGEVTLNSSEALGYTARGRGVLLLTVSNRRIPIFSEARGITPIGMIAGGVAVKMQVALLEWNANTLKWLFPGYTSGTTVSLAPDTVVPGTRLDGSATLSTSFSFASSPSGLTITADKVVPSIADEPIYIGIEEDNVLVLDLDVVYDGSGNQTVITIS